MSVFTFDPKEPANSLQMKCDKHEQDISLQTEQINTLQDEMSRIAKENQDLQQKNEELRMAQIEMEQNI